MLLHGRGHVPVIFLIFLCVFSCETKPLSRSHRHKEQQAKAAQLEQALKDTELLYHEREAELVDEIQALRAQLQSQVKLITTFENQCITKLAALRSEHNLDMEQLAGIKQQVMIELKNRQSTELITAKREHQEAMTQAEEHHVVATEALEKEHEQSIRSQASELNFAEQQMQQDHEDHLEHKKRQWSIERESLMAQHDDEVQLMQHRMETS